MPIVHVSNSGRLDSKENKKYFFFQILHNILTSELPVAPSVLVQH